MTGRDTAPNRGGPSHAGKSAPRLVPAVGGPAPGLALLILALSFIAAIGLMAATATIRSVQAWPGRLAGSITLATAGGGLESADAAAARGAEILGHTPGVSRAWVLDPAPGDALAARVIGLRDMGSEDPATSEDGAGKARLIGATFAAGSPLTGARVKTLLERQGLGVVVDDHGLWTGPLERAAVLWAGGAAAALVVLLGAVWGLIADGVSRAMARHEARLSLVMRLGATEADLTEPFRRALSLTATLGAVVGAVTAVAAVAALIWTPSMAKALQGRGIPALDELDFLAAALWPLAAAPIGALAARSAARAAIRKLA